MSAHIVEDELIRALLRYASVHMDTIYNGKGYHYTSNIDDLACIGQVLVDHNYASVNYRYKSNCKPHPFVYTTECKRLTATEALCACSEYDYQACETDGYRASEAACLIDSIRHAAIRNLPDFLNASWRKL